jgi:error-prone DNA polymerase
MTLEALTQFGVPEDVTAGLAGLVWGWGNDGISDK